MCTIRIHWNPDDEYPVALLANRDERYDRAAEGWAWRADGAYFAPLDVEAGGTWIGVNRAGLLVALTNVYPGREDGPLWSRGGLVAGCLAQRSASAAYRWLRDAVDEHALNWFNLVVMSPEVAWIATWFETDFSTSQLPLGAHEITNDPFAVTRLQAVSGTATEWLDFNANGLMEHPDVCKHGDGYGTRCSHRIRLHRTEFARSEIWQLDGHPCENEYFRIDPGAG